MTLPDQILLLTGDAVPPVFAEFSHRLALLPVDVALADVGGSKAREAGIFLIDAGCTSYTLDDSALDRYLARKTPVLLYTQRVRDLRPFLKRSEQFRRRGFRVEVW